MKPDTTMTGSGVDQQEKPPRRRELELSPQSIIDLLPCYISIQNRDLKIIYANRTFIHDFGDGVGKSCHLVVSGSIDRCRSCPVQRTFQDKQNHVSEASAQTLDGKTCRLIVHTAPILDLAGDVAAVIELSINITNIKNMRKELASLGQSIALTSHGIKNILEGLKGGEYVVDEGIKDGDMRLARKGWEIVKKNIHDITEVSGNILFSSKQRPIKKEAVSPAGLVTDAVELFQNRADAQQIRLTCSVAAELPTVAVDPVAVRRMLNNFISNALEACHRDTAKGDHWINVKVNRYDDDHIMFEVTDNGVGMDEAVRGRIFKEYFSTKGSSGTGLGLAVVKTIVQAHRGFIEVDSVPGEGCTFRVIMAVR